MVEKKLDKSPFFYKIIIYPDQELGYHHEFSDFDNFDGYFLLVLTEAPIIKSPGFRIFQVNRRSRTPMTLSRW
jgi:hypothetical protein